MTDVILSICIFTYNRAHYLSEALESIKIQLRDNPDLNKKVEVAISDNNSVDHTVLVVDQYKKFFNNIKYNKNDQNIGVDLNVFKVVSMATGRYCWYLGDDDVIINGSIAFVVNLLESKECDFVGVNSEPITIDSDYKTKREYDDKMVGAFSDYTDFYINNYCAGNISTLIFNRTKWLELVDCKDYLNGWLYHEPILKILAVTDKKLYYIFGPMVLNGQDARWSEDAGELCAFINANILLERTIKFGFDYYKITNLLEKNKKRILIILLRAKGHGLKINWINYKYIYKNYPPIDNLFLFIFWNFIFVTPNKIIVFIRDIKKYLVSKYKSNH